MSGRKSGLFGYLVPPAAVLAAVIGWSSPSEAYVQQIVIDSTNTANYTPVPLGSSIPGPAISYTIYYGRIFGVLDANDPHNSVVTDLNLAVPVAPGSPNISYISNFEIVTPTNPAARNGLIDYEVPNRGGSAITTTALQQGVTYVESGWQGDLLSQCSGTTGSLPVSPYPCVSLASAPYGTASSTYPFFTPPAGLTDFVIQVPVATTDGNPPNGTNNITGSVYSHIKTGSTGSTAQFVIYSTPFTPYQPESYSMPTPGDAANLNTSNASFWYETSQTVDGVDIGGNGTGPFSGTTSIPSNAWSWAYCPDGPPGTPNPDWICLESGSFNSSYLYEMVFTAANPLVQGVGFAGARDLISFLRYDTTAPGGGSNPISGTVTKAMTAGVSQDGAFIRAFIFYGFNQDESNRIVFDGAWPQIDGRILWANVRWDQPNTLSNLYTEGFEAPVWWADWPNQARGYPAAGMLDACNATTPNTCPQVLETFGSQEFFDNKQGADMVGFCSPCTADIPLPSNVYRYYTQGDTHGGGTISFTWSAPPTTPYTTTPYSSTQTYPNSPIPASYTNNALQYAFMEFLLNGTPMPPSFGGPDGTYPTLASSELAEATSQAAVGFPNIPGFPYGGNQAWPPFVYNFGPDVNYTNQTGYPTIVPPDILRTPPPYIPTVNADGNESGGGLPTVLSQAPLGTYTGWNIIPPGSPYSGQVVQLTGSYYPFYETAAQRTAAGDPRLSLEERYGTNNGYKCVAYQAVHQDVEDRFLLPSDATTLIGTPTTMIGGSNVLLTGYTPTTTDIALGHNVKCGLTSTHDFNGDYISDILWRNSSGNVGMWLMNGSSVSQASVLGNVPTNWSIVGLRDFVGNGNADILWRDTSGNVGIWLMNGSSIVSSTVLGNVPTNWSVAGTGNFNGNGIGDILWRDTAGDVAIWLMNGTTVQQSAVIGNVSTNWVIAGSDNHGDIFWRNTVTGEVGMWVMNGTTIAQAVDFGAVPLSWMIAGIGDFDGNGSEDILWRDTSGNVGIWLMNGTSIQSTAVLGNVPLNWTIAETGDYSGAGTSDILWVDSAGDVATWFMNGTTVSSVTTYGNVGTSWSVQAQAAE